MEIFSFLAFLHDQLTNRNVSCQSFFSCEPRLYKRVCPSIRRLARWSVQNAFFLRAETSLQTTYFIYTNLFVILAVGDNHKKKHSNHFRCGYRIFKRRYIGLLICWSMTLFLNWKICWKIILFRCVLCICMGKKHFPSIGPSIFWSVCLLVYPSIHPSICL